MTIAPVAPSIPSPAIHGSRPVARGEVDHPDSTNSATSTSVANAAVVSPTPTPASSTVTPPLPPGVLFVEEPSGIKIYVGGKQVNPTEAPPSPAIASEEAA
jgi:hypothetical protein